MDLGIPIQINSSKSVHVNGRKLFSSFLSLCANILDQARRLATQGTPINYFSLASSGIALTESITLEDTLEDQLSSLIQKGYQSAVLDILRQYEEYFEVKENVWAVSGIFEEFESQMNELMERDIKVDNTFFTNFCENDVVCTASDSFARYIKLFCDITPEQISRAFKYSFLKCIVMEYCHHAKKYNLILLFTQNPFQPSIEQAIDWTLYRQGLMDFMHTKLHFDNFSLNDIYIPLCGYYQSITTSIGNRIKTIVDSEKWLLDWISDLSNENNIILISGKPASGKTTLLKKIASVLASNMQKVIFIPLKSFAFSPQIYNDVITYCERKLGHNPLRDLRKDEPLILLFDGLDEIALRGENSLERARQFFDYIKREFEANANIKIIVSGRSLVIRENSNLFIGNDNIQYVLDMMPLYMDEDDCSDLFHYGCELMVDKRPEWWRKYAEIRSKEYTDTPDEITDNLGCTSKTLLEITSEPFLLYLLAISYEDKTLDYSKRLSVNKLYNHFVSKIYHNTWNKHRRSGASAIIDEEQFYRFLMEAGLCSWQTGNRQIPIDLIEDKCRKIGFTNVLQRICSDQNIFESIAGLMLLFYIDRSSAHSEMAFEFSHKSFGEYFAGVKIARIMFELFRTTPCPLDVIAQLIEIFEHHYLDEYVTDYIIEELRIIGESDSDKLLIMQENLSALFSSLIIAPIPLNAFEGKDDKALFRSIRNVEKSVYILLCLIGTLTKKRAAPRFQSMTDFCEWINKECGFIGIFAETETVTDYSKYIMRLEFKMGICSGIYLTNHVLRDSLFDDISFEYSSMSFIQIYDCKFIKCDFAETYFSRSRFEDVVFENCTFNGSLLSAVTLSKVKFINCKFDCVFKNVTVESSEFEGNCKNIFSFNSSIDSTTLKVGETTEAMRVDKESTGFVAEII